jgi:hypothetical protein
MATSPRKQADLYPRTHINKRKETKNGPPRENTTIHPYRQKRVPGSWEPGVSGGAERRGKGTVGSDLPCTGSSRTHPASALALALPLSLSLFPGREEGRRAPVYEAGAVEGEGRERNKRIRAGEYASPKLNAAPLPRRRYFARVWSLLGVGSSLWARERERERERGSMGLLCTT